MGKLCTKHKLSTPAFPGLPGSAHHQVSLLWDTDLLHRPHSPGTPKACLLLTPRALSLSLSENQTANPFSPLTPFTTISLLFSTATNADSKAGPHDTLRHQVDFSALYAPCQAARIQDQLEWPSGVASQRLAGQGGDKTATSCCPTGETRIVLQNTYDTPRGIQDKQRQPAVRPLAREATRHKPEGCSPQKVCCEVGRWNSMRNVPK